MMIFFSSDILSREKDPVACIGAYKPFPVMASFSDHGQFVLSSSQFQMLFSSSNTVVYHIASLPSTLYVPASGKKEGKNTQTYFSLQGKTSQSQMFLSNLYTLSHNVNFWLEKQQDIHLELAYMSRISFASSSFSCVQINILLVYCVSLNSVLFMYLPIEKDLGVLADKKLDTRVREIIVHLYLYPSL